MMDLISSYVFPSFQYRGIAYTAPRPPVWQIERHLDGRDKRGPPAFGGVGTRRPPGLCVLCVLCG